MRRPLHASASSSFLAAIFVLALLALPARAAEPASPNPSWSFSIDARDLSRGLLSIEMSLHGFSGPLSLCADMHGAGRSVRDPRAIVLASATKSDANSSQGVAAAVPPREAAAPAKDAAAPQLEDAGTLLRRDPDNADCFAAVAPAEGPLVVRYQVNLADLAGHHGDPDWASRSGDDYVFNDESVLLRPEPLPDEAPIEIAFELPDGVSVAAPWTPLDRSGRRFASDARQYDAGSYVAIGHLRAIDSIESHGGHFDVFALGGAHRASDAALRGWVSRAARAVGDFYRGVPTGRALVLLVPVQGQSDPGVFGSTLHRAAPSVVMFFGADAKDAAFQDDWMATHELFHIGNPRLTSHVRWFSEGSATYYQDVLRARASMEPPEKIWSDLYDGFHRFCSPDDGRSLADESAHLRERHHYVNVYWAGACLFFCVDVLIREHSGGARSLDDVLRGLLTRSMDGALDESELLEALDAATGDQRASEQLNADKPIPIDEIFRKLGIVPIASDRVKLDDSAPESALRRAILGERDGSAAGLPATSNPRSSGSQH